MNERIAQLQLAKERLGDNQRSTPKIQKIPAFLRQNADFAKYCTPTMISFGPIHHGEKYLQQGEDYKLLWTYVYIEEYGKQTNQATDQVAQSLLQTVQNNLVELKNLFTEDAIGKTTDEDFAWMLFVDGCSLLHFMEKINKHHPEALNIKLDQMMYIWRDILMLENQLPRRLLELLRKKGLESHDLEYLMANFQSMGDLQRVIDLNAKHEKKPTPIHILVLAISFFTTLKKGVSKKKLTPSFPSVGEVKRSQEVKVSLQQNKPKPNHILDYARSFLTASTDEDLDTHKDHVKENNGKGVKNQQDHGDAGKQITPNPLKSQVWLTYKNLRDLKAAGIRVKPSQVRGWIWNNVSFKSMWFRGELRLPVFVFDNASPYFFRNLIAYEMCPDFDNSLECSSFFGFMDSLIDGGEDVKELRLAGVIQNLLGSDEELAKLFVEVSRDLPTKIFNNTWRSDAVAYSKKYIQVKYHIEKHYTNKWRTWVAVAVNTYFSTPWSIIAFLAAVAALALTCVQTWYSVHPKNP